MVVRYQIHHIISIKRFISRNRSWNKWLLWPCFIKAIIFLGQFLKSSLYYINLICILRDHILVSLIRRSLYNWFLFLLWSKYKFLLCICLLRNLLICGGKNMVFYSNIIVIVVLQSTFIFINTIITFIIADKVIFIFTIGFFIFFIVSFFFFFVGGFLLFLF